MPPRPTKSSDGGITNISMMKIIEAKEPSASEGMPAALFFAFLLMSPDDLFDRVLSVIF